MATGAAGMKDPPFPRGGGRAGDTPPPHPPPPARCRDGPTPVLRLRSSICRAAAAPGPAARHPPLPRPAPLRHPPPPPPPPPPPRSRARRGPCRAGTFLLLPPGAAGSLRAPPARPGCARGGSSGGRRGPGWRERRGGVSAARGARSGLAAAAATGERCRRGGPGPSSSPAPRSPLPAGARRAALGHGTGGRGGAKGGGRSGAGRREEAPPRRDQPGPGRPRRRAPLAGSGGAEAPPHPPPRSVPKRVTPEPEGTQTLTLLAGLVSSAGPPWHPGVPTRAPVPPKNQGVFIAARAHPPLSWEAAPRWQPPLLCGPRLCLHNGLQSRSGSPLLRLVAFHRCQQVSPQRHGWHPARAVAAHSHLKGRRGVLRCHRLCLLAGWLALGLVGGTAVPQLLECGHLSLPGAGWFHRPVVLELGPGRLLARGTGEELTGGWQLRVRRKYDQPVAPVSLGLGKSGPSGVPLPLLGKLVEGGDGLLARVSAEVPRAGLWLHGLEWLLCPVCIENLQPSPGPGGHGRGDAARPGPQLRSSALTGIPLSWRRRWQGHSIGVGEGVAVRV